MPTNVRDPRSIITPDAFELDSALLGTPLASPRRRLAALIIDLIVIGLLNIFTDGLGLFIWGTVAVFLVAMAFRNPGRRMGQVASIALRGATGCLGIVILAVVVIVALVARSGVGEVAREQIAGVVASAIDAGPAVQQLQRADTEEEAREAIAEILAAAEANDVIDVYDPDDVAEALEALIGNSADFTEDPAGFIQDMTDFAVSGEWQGDPDTVAFGDPGEGAGDEEGEDTATSAVDVETEPAGEAAAEGRDPEEIRKEVGDLTLDEAVDRYRAGLADERPSDDVEMQALQLRILADVAPDTLDALEDAVRDQERATARVMDDLDETRRELEEEQGGVVALLREIWDQAGSAIGIWSIYFTLALTLFQGFTVGKRLLGIRVVRLDGQPINWLFALERAGGYVAGIATGTLGFLQIFWDPNRQCVHDKIGGTVVIMAGAAPDARAAGQAWQAGSGGSAVDAPGGPARYPASRQRPPGGSRPGGRSPGTTDRPDRGDAGSSGGGRSA